MARHARKGKNPGPVDAWLDTLGFYRKNVAYDETCLFRAVSEQLFSCQIHHERCRKEVIEYARANYNKFNCLMTKECFFKHLEQLELHMVICGDIELQIISEKYKKNIVVFNGNIKQISNNTSANFDDSLMVCLMGTDHYDVVYKRDYIQTAGFCQSIVYGIVYENVFHIPKITKIVQTMLYEKTTLMVVNSECNEGHKNNEKAKLEKDPEKLCKEGILNDYEYMLQTNIAPFPFKVAKALDENIYRNIEYDTWTEMRKELRLGQWYYGDNNLILGTCCLLTTDDGILQCYIQEIKKQEDKCVVYITSLAEKRTVKYSDLQPEADAKPWPLPYRFARYTNSAEAPEVKTVDVNNNNDKNKRSLRRRRDNKRNQSHSSNDSTPNLTLPIKTDVLNNSIKDFEGSPLHMQQQQLQNFEQQDTQVVESHQNVDYAEYTTEASWVKTVSAAEQSVVPRNTAPSQGVYGYMPKQVVPVTPEITYPDTFYNSQRTQTWIPAVDQLHTPQEHMPQSPQDMIVSPNPYPYYYDQLYQSPLVPVSTLPATSPHVTFYPTMFPATTPVTPILYPSGHETQDVIIMSPNTAEPYAGMYSPSYNPPIDMSFMSPSYVYPSTTTWYRPPPVDAQGFIFPTAVPAQK